MSIPAITGYKREEILKIAEQYGISNIRVFGSVATGDADENSDLDLLIDMELEAIKYPVIREAILSQERPL